LDDQRPLGYAPRVTYRPATRGRARVALRSIGQENLTLPRNSAHSELGVPPKGSWAMAADGSFSVRIHGRCRRSGAAGSRCGYLDDFFKLAVCGIPRRCQVLL